LDDKFNVNVAWFQVTRTDFLVTVGTDTIPVGEQKTEGVDLDISAEPVPGWNLYANYSYQDAELVDVPVTGTTPAVNGNRPTGIPENSASFWSTYELQGGPLKGFGFGGGLTYRDTIFINQANTSEVPDYVTGDLVFFYRHDWLEAQLNITNVGDATYFRNGVNSGALPGDPLAVQGTVKVHF
jgi:iron complex outermembrane receptor protein